MQKIKKILKITGGRAEWIDERGNDADAPTIPLGANVALEIDVRQAINDGLTDNLPAYPIAELAADAYYFALDGDYDHATDPKMLRLTGITVTAGALLPDGTARTIITATVPNTNYTGLKTALLVAESLIMEGEIGGNDSGAASTFVFAFPVIVRNRVWYPDDAPESVTADPDYLNSVENLAYINDAVATAVATAVAEIDGEDGTSNFIYVAYASDDAGTDFNLAPSASLPYVAIIISETELTPPVVGDFAAATWVKYIGKDGGDGLKIDAIGLLADRDDYDAAAIGFTYLATDVQEDDDGRPYNLLYVRTTSTQGTWSDGAIAYIGPQGPTGPASTVPGPRGADATIIPDLVFTSGDLVEDIAYGGSLTISGIKAIAQVELYDTNGDGVVIERGDALANGKCIVKTKYADNETIVYFGELDVTNGGRVRFAQGTAANAITIDGAGSMMAITKLRLIRPSATLPVHLVIEASADRDFASVSTVVDTATVEADRDRVLAWDGAEFVPMPETGFGFGYVGALVLVDMSQLDSPSFIRYRWDYVGSDRTVYRYTYFPSCGEASTADGGGAAATTGSLQFNLAGDLSGEGRWSIDEGITWRESGEIVTGLPPWTFAVTFKAVTGYTEPTDTTAAVVAGELTTATATYVSASATGNFAYVLVGSTPNLITDEADPTKCFGPTATGFGYHIINGKLYAYGDGLHQIGAATDWTDVAGGYLGSGFFGEAGGSGHAIRGAGELYAISGLNIAKIGTATDWTAVTFGYALKGAGDTLYYLSGTTITEIAAGMTLPMMSGSFGYVIDADGKLYKLVGATLTQVGAATNWTSVSAGYYGGKLAYATNSSGALFAIDDTTATQVGAATDWGSISGNSDATLPAYGQRGENGDLYALIGTTATLISEGWGLGTLHASLGQGYYMTPGGGLFRVSGSAVPVQIGADEDWTYISGAFAPLGVRG
jgi:hypothetical protein